MKLLRVLAAAAMAVSFAPVTAQAQGIPKTVPAEFPPAGYDGRQYVDSNGCVFIRAGVDGAVNWVPRMTRGRTQICGLQPTLGASARAVATAPRATAPAQSSAQASVRAPAATPRVVRATAPQKPMRAAPAASYRSAPKPVAAPVVPSAPRVIATATAPAQTARSCDRGNAVSNRYINSTTRYAIRCGPQTSAHVTQKVGGAQYRTAAPSGLIAPAAPGTPVSPDTVYRKYEHNGVIYYKTAEVRVAPRHVYENQLAAREGLHMPAGYEPIWEDDRLNPYRAHQTFAGKAQMERTWTNHLPRRLQERKAGPTVTATTVHAHARPAHNSYVGYASNSAAGGVTRASQEPVAQAAPESRAAQKASHRYVQLGAFTDPSHARSTAQKIANSGYPARLGTHERNGAVYTLVLTGPYKTQSDLEQGMSFVRGMGFTQATLRR